ncbi:serine/threonine protein kinase [Pyxidicoccus trucidator]|uniref:serine/threonine protein kinase n=1 Tax=Pyxidicoccus trucidator TaxID=2709662 RepID=UPI0013DBB0B1|nr:serine/threonine-protein kinase [Pyxidicoccus trucidator]
MSGIERFGPYRILRELGAGGMGRVSLAEREDREGPVVVKRMNAELAADPRFRRRLLREAEVAAGLQHPNIVQVLDTGVIDDQLYLAMEYVPGSSLAGVLAASRPVPLPLVPVLHAVAQTCDGLAYVHRFAEPRTGRWMELVHRDVSLDNLLVSYSGEVKIADFGIVKTADGTQTTSGVIMGKLGYMSPEQIRDETLDARSDVYSLGVCLFELVAGKRPLPAHRARSVMEAVLYDAPPPLEQFRQDVPPALSALVARMLAKDRKARPANCEEVAKELRAVLAGREDSTLFPSRLLEAQPRNRSRHAPLEVATEVEGRPATKPQRLQGPAPETVAQEPRNLAPAARKPTPVPVAQEPRPVAPAARKLTPMPGPEERRPEALTLAPAHVSAPGAEARRPPPGHAPPEGKATSAPGPEAHRPASAPEPARQPTPEPRYEHSLSSLPTDTPSSEHSVHSVPTRATSASPEHSVHSVHTRATSVSPEHSVHSVHTRATMPKHGSSAHEEEDPSLAEQSTRLLAAPSRKRLLRRWAAVGLGGLVLLGAAACWWWV